MVCPGGEVSLQTKVGESGITFPSPHPRLTPSQPGNRRQDLHGVWVGIYEFKGGASLKFRGERKF